MVTTTTISKKDIHMTITSNNNLISETSFSECFMENNDLLVVSTVSPGSLFHVQKGDDDIKINLLDQNSEMSDNKLSFDETLSLVANRNSFEELMELYNGDNILSILTEIIENAPDGCKLDSLIECIFGIYYSSTFDWEFIFQTLVSTSRYSIGRLLNEEIDFNSLI